MISSTVLIGGALLLVYWGNRTAILVIGLGAVVLGLLGLI